MSFLGLGEKNGIRCDPTPEGHLRCRPYKADKGQKFATGSDVTFNIDPQTCKATFVGEIDMLNDDEDQINKIARNLETACKKGLV